MRTKAVLTVLLSGLLSGSLLALAACGKAGEDPAVLDSASAEVDATDAVVDAGPVDSATSAPAPAAASLDTGALNERRDPERLLRYYVSAVRVGDWDAGAQAWSLDAQMTAQKLQAEFDGANPRLAVGKGDMERAAGSLYYEAPIVVDFGDGRPSKRGTIVLHRVNDVPGASDLQLNWRIERTSTLTQ
ncbi:hypothetical protein [Novosphingobium guangzhouense]|uniref:Lipoprotein n=1 Tax=Novosphingobium guangzhouense TaxID=1850347 RepID=A0A2K2FUH1_9SPHN|nr:hypothetical protein [Novosphingobium guangzhouense]PNU02439.1 hypothetical protein A8V01_08595 [Novosphingobium guangzhouense]